MLKDFITILLYFLFLPLYTDYDDYKGILIYLKAIYLYHQTFFIHLYIVALLTLNSSNAFGTPLYFYIQ